MKPSTEPIMGTLRPFWGYLTALESPVDEAERESGLIVPLAHDGDDGLRRGVVLQVAANAVSETFDKLEQGDVIYFTSSLRIADVLLVSLSDIVAYESNTSRE